MTSSTLVSRHRPGSPTWRRLAAVAAVSLIAPLVAAAPAATAEPARPAAVAAADAPMLKVAITSSIDTLNPFLAILASSTGILKFQYESLVQYGKNNETTPGLSDKWETSADGKTWTFHIPADRKWSDGQPLTAEDVAWTFQQVQTKKELQTANGGLVDNFVSVTASDPQTVVFVLKAAQASNPGTEMPIVPKHVWEKQDAAKYGNDKDTVGSGPYVIKSYTENQSVELVTNQNFWRGASKIGGLTYVYYKNLDAAVQALKTGEVDIVNGLTPDQLTGLTGVQGITTNSGAGRRYQAMAINPGAKDIDGKPMGDGNPALQDITLRTAILTAIDNKTLLEKVLQGKGKLGETEMPTVYPDYYGFGPDAKKRTFDIAAANKMLDDAGYTKGADGIRNDKQGKPLNLRLMGRNSDPTHALLAQFVQGWLKEIGIGTTVALVDPKQVNNDSTLGKYDLYFTGWGIGPDPDFQLSINRCSSLPNADGSGATSENNWCDPEFDKLYDAQHTELDHAKRAELVKKAFTMIHNAAINDVIYYADSLEAYRSDKFGGFTKQPEGTGTILGQNGYWGLYTAVPAGAAGAQSGAAQSSGATSGTTDGQASASGSSTGMAWWWWLIIGAAVVLLAALAFAMTRRTKTTADDRE